jgi:xylulokinase
MHHYLGVDIGTFETKGVLTDGDGRIIAQAARAHKMLVPEPGWAEHRPEQDWWGDFIFVTKALLSTSKIDPKSIRCIATSAIGPCMLPVDKDGNALMNGVLYGVDTRAHKEIAELNQLIGEDAIFTRGNNALTSQSVGPKILWVKNQRPEIYAKTATFMTSTSFLVMKLTGRRVIDHYTAANSSPLYDVAKNDWAFDLAPHIARADQMPELLWSTDIAGHIGKAAALETGLAEGTPVTCGTIDAAAEAVSVGVLEPNEMMIMYGSTIFIIMPTEKRLTDPRLWYAPWLFKGQHTAMAGLATSGTLTHWFRDQFGKELSGETAFIELATEAAASPPGANGLIVLPYFSGERTPIYDTNAKGMIFGLNLTHTRGDIYRAFLEGIALGTAHVTDTFKEAGAPPNIIRAVGGGTKNQVWAQATSDATGLTQVVCEKTFGASYGNAFLAALAMGDVATNEILAWNKIEREIKPDASTQAVYAKHNRLFRKLYERTKDVMAELA